MPKVLRETPAVETWRLVTSREEGVTLCIHGVNLRRVDPLATCDACRTEIMYDGEDDTSRRYPSVGVDDGECIHGVTLSSPCADCHRMAEDEVETNE